MKVYNQEQLGNLRASGRILRGAFEVLEKAVKAGVSTLELDKIAEQYIIQKGGEPCFKGYQNYGFSICASVNEESIHGMPRKDKVLKDGDIISLDCGVRYPKGKKGMCTDAARTYGVGKISNKARQLIEVCEQCFHVATKDLRAGVRVGTIGEKIEAFIGGRYGIIDTYFGHGIGENVHEDPLIPNFNVANADEKRREKLIERASVILPEGVVICIEPMINCGTKEVKTGKDGWTVNTVDGELAAHYENTLIVWKDRVEIVTLGQYL